jgi:hypothetical protein
LRGLAGDDVKEDVKWWHEFQEERAKSNLTEKQSNSSEKTTDKRNKKKIFCEDILT